MKRTQWGSSRGMSSFLIINACLCTSFTLLCAITSYNFRFILKSSRLLLHFFLKKFLVFSVSALPSSFNWCTRTRIFSIF
ncbi:uncharacterized protein EV154DRAFT_502072 [Mucor mucedo]|uniref:uncharacterized protein n=1 Tax=Mucor mucedo TaxID=29922 RepID=UPI002220A250|nr:uncharacterized protein EV154DRAFT_502072 [Mucor mucedo]KAI7893440.1 hypothetical protein EV154DRAFT_502072 [Mucor mucedo]